MPTDITYGYTYDVLGNIATYTENGTTYTYTYDAQNQLTSVKTNGTTTHQYSYDAVGNILSASDGTGSHTYTYGNTTWRDLLTKYDGHEIKYDASGNPTTYYNGKDWTMSWAEGRRLVSANGDGKSLTFTYDSEGLRLTKKVGSTTYNYSYAGGKLLRQTGGNTLDFFYDASGNPYALKYNGTLYYYITNLQGDVLHIVNTSGTPVVSYTYDPYGKPLTPTGTLASTLGAHNPLRYRGYVYDQETGLYYLQSRYYDPEIGRFINADAYASTGQGVLGCNMFEYCLNNPILYLDAEGTVPMEIPMIENGLNLPQSGGVPVSIDGTTYYYAIDIQHGEVYEYWFDGDGNLVWARHHSNHNKPWAHDNPHDHKGGKDKNGNNTLTSGPLPKDDRFKGPKQIEKIRKIDDTATNMIAVAATTVVVYQIAKWVFASLLAPVSGGSSYFFAIVLP